MTAPGEIEAPATGDRSADRLFAGPGELRARCRALDWAATPLGPVDSWPTSLRTAAALVLAAPMPMILLWGPELVQLYNDGYAAIMRARHPAGLGQRTAECWPEVWEFNAPLYEGVRERGEAYAFTDERLVIERQGDPEEAFFALTYSPVFDEAGSVGGVLVTVVETTADVRARAAREVERERLLAAERAAAAELRAVIESMTDAVYIGGAEGITTANQAALDQLGFATPEELNRSVGTLAEEIQTRDAATGEFIPVERQAFTRALGGERVVQDVVVRHRATGEDRVVRCAAAPVVIDGRVVAAVALNTDVTEVRQAAAERERLVAALTVERSRLATVFARSPSILALVRGPQHVFELANEAYLRLIGHRDVIGKPLLEAVPELRGQGFEKLLDAVVATGEPFVGREVATWVVRAPGEAAEERFFDFVYLPVNEVDGSRSGVIAHGTDVTEQVMARREVERLLHESENARAEAEESRVEAEAANRAKSEFLAMMSHELRTPLNAIGGYAELMEMGIRGPVTSQQGEDLRRIQSSQRHLLSLVNEVLNYARIETGTVRYDIADVPLGGVVASVEPLVAPQLAAKGLTYVVVPCSPGLVARADREKVRQVLLNLLSNAVKFTDPGGRVEVRCDGDEARALMHVRDTGIGIPPAELGRIFEPFVQVNASLTRTHEGTGLGLAISRDLARGMGGELTVESTPGVGSTFTLVLKRV